MFFGKISSMAASVAENKEGLKFLVTAGPHARKMVGIWLFASAAWVFSMVVLDGVTRLTRSALSMTDWKFTGRLPPLIDEDWLAEFEKYKQSPEYKQSVQTAGLIGWWMVKSGLEEPPSEYVEPRVSPYCLAAHLTSAFAIYCGLFWTALSVVMPESLACVRGAAKVLLLSGAFVAGNDAGRAFNTFPKMGNTWIPDDIFSMKPIMRNFFENTATVQLDHRILATATLAAIGGLWWSTRKLDMHPAVRHLIGSTMGMAALQVTLGISTLLSYVPVSLGTAHQAGAFDSFNIHDPAQSHCASTFSVTSQDVTLCRENFLILIP
ncbi:cytochrome c oxidase assembly protein cox15 [Nicotiana attenuata]|uniref:Cytochrome c oxidase assembly protein cox15 n=1 Tax=Nicotiana attenuata TaxID=49451 RepID=A0A1J6IAN5_NICAT|nr:cytochrome c oxidase assembly protein cox15 [Nicotiana attenuata]